jgi:diamine N-acetyltransferase
MATSDYLKVQLGAFELRPIDHALAEKLGPALAAIDPWTTLNFPASRFIAFFTREDPALRRFVAFVNDETVGVVCVRHPWLGGPYLQLLAVLPAFQGMQLGRKMLGWFEAQTTVEDKWLWLCCSTFNTRAFDFYRAHGYEKVATLTGVIVDNSDDFLMRKRVIA